MLLDKKINNYSKPIRFAVSREICNSIKLREFGSKPAGGQQAQGSGTPIFPCKPPDKIV
jgi:hypothetical protein